jgi:hypothetical protein
MSVMDPFLKIAAPLPSWIPQGNPVAAHKTPWLAHLCPQLRGNIAYAYLTGNCLQECIIQSRNLH